MNTASSGLDGMTTTSNVTNSKGRWRNRRRSLFGAALALATAAAATVAVVGGNVDSAEAQFGAEPPPPTNTLCETDLPSQADYYAGNNSLAWDTDALDTNGDGGALVSVVIPLWSVDGDATGGYDAPIAHSGAFTYAVVLDNTGDPFDPNVDNHPSYHPMSSSAPLVLTGDGSGPSVTVDLPAGCRYMMSVRSDGHDLGGSWIRIESDSEFVANDIDLVTNDALPMARATVRAFHDFAQVNAQFDPGETGLAGFDVVFNDHGEQSVDYFGNPLCTNYVMAGTTLAPGDLDGDGMPTVEGVNPGGNCIADAEGRLTIDYLTAGKFELHVIPPDSTNWVQTTTIEGKHVIDIWIQPGDDGIGGEFIGDIDAGTFQAVGFVSPDIYPTIDDGIVDNDIDYQYPFAPDATNGADLTGCFFNGQLYPTEDGIKTVVQNGLENADGTVEPLFNSYVALNDVGNHDSMMGLAETDAGGCFTFEDVPQGTYQLAVWDYELYYIIGFYNVTIGAADAGGTVDMGDNFVLRWFGWSSGYVFYDHGVSASGHAFTYDELKDDSDFAAGNGVRDCVGQATEHGVPKLDFDYYAPTADCEPGLPLVEILVRNRDGQVWTAGVTGPTGYYEIPNIWSPMFRMQVLEVGAPELDFTGHSVHDQFNGNVVDTQGNCPDDVADILDGDPADNPGLGTLEEQNCLPAELGGGLLVSSIFQQGKRTNVDFGKLSYLSPDAPNYIGSGAPGHGNGGIAGGLIQTVTRAEWGSSKFGVEDNETGVPSATVTLYGFADGCTDTDPVSGLSGTDNPDCYTDELQSLQTDSYQHPGEDRNGQTCTMPTFDGTAFSDVNPTFGPLGDDCTGSWLLGSHTKDGAWNGGFAFAGLDFGHYVVEVTEPEGFQMVKENDLNTEEGNEYVPAVPAPGCVGEYHFAQLDDAYSSPYDAFDDDFGAGTYDGSTAPVRLCDRRMVRVQPFRNAALDMMLMTTGMDRSFQSNFVDANEDGVPDAAPVDPYTIADQDWHSTQTVPKPGRYFGLVLDDLTMTANQNSLTFGEQQGAAYIPIGVYDHTGNHVTTFWTDENGHYEVLLPSTYSINRLTPGGVGPQMYELIINDPGPDAPGTLNWGYDATYITNPQIRETFPGVMTKADTPVLSLASGPCSLPTGTPQLFEVSHVWGEIGDIDPLLIHGINLTDASVWMTPISQTTGLATGLAIDVTGYSSVASTLLPDGSVYDTVTVVMDDAVDDEPLEAAPYQVSFSDGTALGDSPRNGITYHLIGTGYDLQVWTVDEPATATDKVIQDEIQDALANGDGREPLIVVPVGTYRESIVVHDGMIIQGHGPGGIIGVGTEQGPVAQVETPYALFTGSVISPFGSLLDSSMFGPWETLVDSLDWDENQGVEVGPAFQVLLEEGDVDVDHAFQIDGFGITGGRAQNGAIHVNGHADGLLISNMAIQANNASQGGAAINLGTHSLETYESVAVGENPDWDAGDGTDPDDDGDPRYLGTHYRVNGRVMPAPAGLGDLAQIDGDSNANNDGVVIRDNRILQNGGTTLAGGVGVFNGNDYQFLDNDVCGNYSAEYGGGISHTGVSTGEIIGNAFQNNEAFDEGGAIFIGAEIVAGNPVGSGSGNVTVEDNQILFNLSGDDGGGIMVLHSGESPLRIVNNFISNNVATDIGGGIHLSNAAQSSDGALDFVISHNTIANNLSASAGEDSGGMVCTVPSGEFAGLDSTCPRAGGLTTEPHASLFTPDDSSTFSDPLLENNIFWNNRAGAVIDGVVDDEGNVVQVLLDDVPIFDTPDIGVYDGTLDMAPTMLLSPVNSVLTVDYPDGGPSDISNVVGADPLFMLDLQIETAIKTQPAPQLGQAGNITMVFPAVTPIEATNYHLASVTSPAVDLASTSPVLLDIDGEARSATDPDSGADELGSATLAALMVFSTTRTADGPVLDHDAQAWSGTAITTLLEGIGTNGNDDIDAIHALSTTEFLVSFMGSGVVLPGGAGTVNDEDIVHVDISGGAPGVWSLAVDGSALGLSYGSQDIDALHRLPNGEYLVSFVGRGGSGASEGYADIPTQGGTMSVQDEDIVRMVPVSTHVDGYIDDAYFVEYFRGASIDLDGGEYGDVDGFALIDGGTSFLLSMKQWNFLEGEWIADEDVIRCDGVQIVLGIAECEVAETLYFDGSAEGLSWNDVNAVSGPLAG